MTQTPYQPGISYLPKYGDRYMNTNDFAPAQGSPSSAKAGAVTTTAQLVPGQGGTVPYTGAPPATNAGTVTMADPFANNPQFQSIMDRTDTPSFGVQPMIGFRQNINYDPGADNNIPPFTPTDPDTGGGSTGGGSYFVSDDSDDNTGPGATSYDGGNTWYSNNEPIDDEYSGGGFEITTSPSTPDDDIDDLEGGSWMDWEDPSTGVDDFSGTGYTDDMTVYDDDSGNATSNNDYQYDDGGDDDYSGVGTDFTNIDIGTSDDDDDAYNSDWQNWDTPDTSSDSGGGGGSDSICFITTAIVNRRGEADDGETLTKLRSFRDTFMGGKESDDLKEYYDIAPAIIKAIPKDHSDWDWIEKQIDLSIAKIDNNQPHDAYNIYKTMVLKLKETWL